MWTNRGVLHQLAEITFTAQAFYELGVAYYSIDTSQLGLEEGDTLDVYANDFHAGSQAYDVLPAQLQSFSGEIEFSVTVIKANGTTRRGKRKAILEVYDPCGGQLPPGISDLRFTRNNGEPFVRVSWYSDDDYFELAVNDAPHVWFKPNDVNGSWVNEAHTFTVDVPIEYGTTYNVRVTMYSYNGMGCFTQQQITVNVPVATFHDYYDPDSPTVPQGTDYFSTHFAHPQWVRGLTVSWPSPIPLTVGANVDDVRAEYATGTSEWHIMADGGFITMTIPNNYDSVDRILTLEAALAPLYNGVNVNSWYSPALCRDAFGDKDGLLAWKFRYLLAGVPVYLGGYNPPVNLISSWTSRGTNGDLWLNLVQGQGTAIVPKPTLYTMSDPNGLYCLTTLLDYDASIGYQRLPYSGYVSYQVRKPASGVVPTSLKYAVVSGNGGTVLETGVLTSGEYRQTTNEVFVVGGIATPNNQSSDNYLTLTEVLWG